MGLQVTMLDEHRGGSDIVFYGNSGEPILFNN